MKLVTYIHKEETKVGVIGTDPECIIPAAALGYEVGDMTAFIKALNGSLPVIPDGAIGDAFAECKLLSPIPEPAQDVLCMGVNYFDHKSETVKGGMSYDAKATNAIYFSKRVNRAVGHGEPVDGHFDICDSLDYEVELGVILGKDAKNVPMEQVKDYVLGYTIVNDFSARNLQKKHQQWYFGKSLDNHTVIGPWIVTKDEFDWLPEIDLRCYVNGELRQNGNTSLMITPFDYVIHEMSQGMTLKAGTVIATGTPSGVAMAMDPPVWLQKGDVVRCEIDGIGVLENTIV